MEGTALLCKLPAGFLGVGEPLIYGVTLPMFKPFITAGIGAGFGGAFVMLTHVMASSWGPSGLVAIPIMKPESMLNFFLGLLISYIAGFIESLPSDERVNVIGQVPKEYHLLLNHIVNGTKIRFVKL